MTANSSSENQNAAASTQDVRGSGLSVASGSASSFPTEFRGCQWNDGWEFDAPCVIYYPAAHMCFGIGGNTGHLDSMVEDICMNLSLKWDHNDGGLDHECEWRGWSKSGFARRRAARHVVFKLKWQDGPDGPEWNVVDRKETYGLPSLNVEISHDRERRTDESKP